MLICLMVLSYLFFLNSQVAAQPLLKTEIDMIASSNDTQMFVAVPGYKEIKRYREYFNKIEIQSGLSEEELSMIGRWDIPDETINNTIVGFKDYSINGTLTILPNKKFMIKYNWFSKSFPIVCVTGSWHVENKSLITKVELVITVKPPVEFEIKDGAVKPRKDSYTVCRPDWPSKTIYDNIEEVDLKYGYLYYPFKTVLDEALLPVIIPSRYWTDRRRGTRFASEEMYGRSFLIQEYEDYLRFANLDLMRIEEIITNKYY